MTNELTTQMEQQDVASSLEVNSLLNANKETIHNRVQYVIDGIRNGELDPIQSLIFAKKGKELFDLLEKNARPYAEGKGINKGYSAYDCMIVEKNSPSIYDFTACGDSEWNRLQNLLTETKEAIKKREDFLKVLTEPVFIESTGEQVNPPGVTFGKLTLALTLK